MVQRKFQNLARQIPLNLFFIIIVDSIIDALSFFPPSSQPPPHPRVMHICISVL